MSFLTGLWNKTPATPAATAPTQQVQQAGNGQPPAAQPNTPSGNGPVSKLPAGTVPNSTTVLDDFQSLLTPKQQAQAPAVPAKVFGHVDPAAMQKQIDSANFTASLPQDRVAAALGGDVNAFTEVLNSAVRNAFAANVQLTQGMVEHGVNFAQQQINTGLDSRIRDFQVRTHNPNIDNPALQHPVGKSMLAGITRQIASANPEMTPDQVHQAATENFQAFLQLAAGPNQNSSASSTPAAPEVNWMKYADS